MHQFVRNATTQSRYHAKGAACNGCGLNTLVMFIEKMWTHTLLGATFIDEPPTTLRLRMWFLVPSFDMLCSRHEAGYECIHPSIATEI